MFNVVEEHNDEASVSPALGIEAHAEFAYDITWAISGR